MSPNVIGLSCRQAARNAKENIRRNNEIAKLKKNRRQYYYQIEDFMRRNKFNDEAEIWEENIKKGETTEEEYVKWLKSQ